MDTYPEIQIHTLGYGYILWDTDTYPGIRINTLEYGYIHTLGYEYISLGIC